MEGRRMPYKWPSDTDFARWELDVLDRACPACGRMMYICDHRYRRLLTLKGPVQLVCKLNGRTRGASRAIDRRRFAAVSHSPRTTLPTRSAEPTQDYEESTIEEEAIDSLG